ncbi:coatomer subunit zeta-2 isoform X3 [Rhinatrema bivittatum]|uniref:coatomer subunit zeta-2 isoform X3 n=1 Tax=Rhinatrema bivittatum TaxID=194408 RepID=UPI00112BECC2|nr:coatomer subunit zeta-2 isoform X3 [Rhinatrema bivittatum]
MEPNTLLPEPSLYVVKAMFILDSDGQRLVAKYYDETFPSAKEQKNFEKNTFNKTHRAEGEITFLEGMTIVYKSSIDLFFYVVGSSQENELMLVSVLTCLFESLSHMLRKTVEKQSLLENLDSAFLVMDEIVDCGLPPSLPMDSFYLTISLVLQSRATLCPEGARRRQHRG